MRQDIFDSSIPASYPSVEIGVEQLYQSFKARIIRELVAKKPNYCGADADYYQSQYLHLVDTAKDQP